MLDFLPSTRWDGGATTSLCVQMPGVTSLGNFADFIFLIDFLGRLTCKEELAFILLLFYFA